MKGEIKGFRNIVKETIISVSDPHGVVLSYGIDNFGATLSEA